MARNLCHVIEEYHRVLIQIDDTNRFWRYFIAIMYFSHIPLNCLLLNQLIFAAVKDEIVTVLMLTLFQESIAVLIAVSFSAGMVNAEAKKCFVALNSVLTKEKNVRLKLKVRKLSIFCFYFITFIEIKSVYFITFYENKKPLFNYFLMK